MRVTLRQHLRLAIVQILVILDGHLAQLVDSLGSFRLQVLELVFETL